MHKFINQSQFKKIAIAAICSAGMLACQPSGKLDDACLDTGVSHELANFRKKHIKDIHYQLFFDIPKDTKEEIKGRVDVSCDITDSRAFILDFKANSNQIDSVLLNKKRIPFKYSHEHISLEEPLTENRNTVSVYFTCSNQSLNRRDQFLYTLLVPDRARTVFPCFDQPDLKALYKLNLEIPYEWKAVANGGLASTEEKNTKNTKRKLISFNQTDPLSTYLFSFVVGELSKEDFNRGERTISVFHRENDPYKMAQCKEIAKEVFDALEWMETYTSIPYPFEKYDLIIVPGFQFGGMEHTGATLYTDGRMFLNKQSTLRERLSRSALIAHETAHMWFGDYVTMKWFDDVWTKEVFANYFASQMVEERFPDINHQLNFIIDYLPGAYAEERTKGTNSIKQTLDNLQNAGLVYGNIIYNKSPLIMNMLADKMGKEMFRDGLRKYLKTYAYDNATWDDLIAILDDFAVDDLKSWSHCWVNEKGRPTIEAHLQGNELVVTQQDELKRGLCWPQKISYLICDGEGHKESVIVNFPDDKQQVVKVPLKEITTTSPMVVILPNNDGKGYGIFEINEEQHIAIWKAMQTYLDSDSKSEILRGSLLINLYENLRHGNLSPETFRNEILKHIEKEKNPLLYSLALGYLGDCQKWYLTDSEIVERTLWKLIQDQKDPSFRLQAFRLYYNLANSNEAIDRLYTIWNEYRMPFECHLSERDYMKLSYTLAIHLPQQAETILKTQAQRITQADRKNEFAFISAAASPSVNKRDSIFSMLLKPENRRIEPWASQALSLLNHPLREQESLHYIRPALEEMKEIQRTGDIFFPRAWAKALLSGHTSPQAALEVQRFFEDNPKYPEMLGNKIKQQAGHLENR